MTIYHGREWTLWYDQEAVEGTSDTGATLLALAHHAEVEISVPPDPVGVRQSGSADYASHQKGVEVVVANVKFNPSGANGLAFIKNFASVDNSFTLVAKAGAIFQVLRGCKVKQITCTGTLYPQAGPLECTAEIWAWTVNGTEPTTAAYESIPTSFVNWSDTVISFGGSNVTDWWNYSWSIDNKLIRKPSSTGVTTTIKSGERDGRCTIVRDVIDNTVTDFDFAKNATSKDAVFNYVSSSAVFTFGSGALTDVAVTHSITNLSGKKLDLKAATIGIA